VGLVSTLALTFIAPWTGLLAGALGGTGLILLYLLRLRRSSLRVGSTLLWQAAAQDMEVNVPWRRPRAGWLLALQMLAVLAMAGAIARPVIDAGGGAASRTLILIDASASMSATDGELPGLSPFAIGGGARQAGANRAEADGPARATRLDQASARAKELVRAARATPGARLMVASFAARPEVRTGWTRDRAALDGAIDAVVPTDQPADLAAAIDLIASLAPEADGPEPGADGAPSLLTVIILSDGGLAPLAERGVPSGVDLRLLRCGPALEASVGGSAAGITPSTPSTPSTLGTVSSVSGNVGIVSASARRDYEDPGTLRVSARLVSNQRGPVRVTLRAELREALVGTTIVEIPGAAATALGEATASFAITDREGGVLSLRLMNPDALTSDNQVWMALDAPGRPRIVLAGPGERGVEADAFLRAFQQAAGAPPYEAIGREELARRLASPAGFEGVDLLVLDRITPARLPGVPTVSVGAGLPGAGVTLQAGTATGLRRWRAVRWDRQHPVMRDVDLAPVEFSSAAWLELGSLATPLAFGPRGPIVAAASTGAVKRLVIAPAIDASTWGADVSLAVMLGNAIDWLTLRGQAGAARWTTTARVASVVAVPGASEVTITGPLDVRAGERGGVRSPEPVTRAVRVPSAAGPGEPEPPVNAIAPGMPASAAASPTGAASPAVPIGPTTAGLAALGREVALGVPARVGLYQLMGTEPGQSPLAVNLFDERESSLETSATITLGPGGPRVGAGEGGPSRREVWPWLVMAALGLLALESVLYAARQRA